VARFFRFIRTAESSLGRGHQLLYSSGLRLVAILGELRFERFSGSFHGLRSGFLRHYLQGPPSVFASRELTHSLMRIEQKWEDSDLYSRNRGTSLLKMRMLIRITDRLTIAGLFLVIGYKLLNRNYLELLLQHTVKLSRERIRPSGFAFPNHDYAPTKAAEFSLDLLVTYLIRIELGGPELAIRFGSVCKSALRMSMPETAVNEDNRVVAWKHDIRFAR
jgi:hypothetical protein